MIAEAKTEMQRDRERLHREIDTAKDQALKEFAEASDKPDFSSVEMERIAALARGNFGVDEEPMSYKGTMERVTT